MSLSHNFLSAKMSCTIAGETRRRVLPESLYIASESKPKAAVFTHLRHWLRSDSDEFQAGLTSLGRESQSKFALDSWPNLRYT
jgi:hypothetical protein